MGIFGFLGDMTTTELVIRSVGAGFIIGSLVSTISRRTSYKIIGRLIKSGATAPQTALTIKQIELGGPIVKRELREDSPLRRGVCLSDDPTADANAANDGGRIRKKLDFNKARFYIPKEKIPYLKARYPSGASIATWIICALIIAAGAEIAVHFAPGLINLIPS